MNKYLLSFIGCVGLATCLSAQAETQATATVALYTPATLSIEATTTGKRISKELERQTELFGFTVTASEAVAAEGVYMTPSDANINGGNLWAVNTSGAQTIQLVDLDNRSSWTPTLDPANKPSWTNKNPIVASTPYGELKFGNRDASTYPAGTHALTMNVVLKSN
ncbi:hypothetical protein [Escherichia coli]|uniref:hypothetical protein n=1 Tax=Escherichia coli TaxID=562 RepID=UPI000BE1FF18|nr:hypothetical protein [Escherichia coli]